MPWRMIKFSPRHAQMRIMIRMRKRGHSHLNGRERELEQLLFPMSSLLQRRQQGVKRERVLHPLLPTQPLSRRQWQNSSLCIYLYQGRRCNPGNVERGVSCLGSPNGVLIARYFRPAAGISPWDGRPVQCRRRWLSCDFVLQLDEGTECKRGCYLLNGFCETTGECRCKSGWQASHNCIPAQPCANNSTCIESEDGGYICICGQEFIGSHCQLRKGSCYINGSLCQNGGSCFDDNGFAVKAYCLCLPGFTGEFCQISINNCNPNPCANNGTCTDLVSDFSCFCLGGFTGKSCEYSVTSCLSHPCQNGGTCHDHPGGGFDCTCLPEYGGETCQNQTFESFNRDAKENVSKHAGTSWVRRGKPFHPLLQASHKSTHQQGNGMLKITVKETIHKSNPLLNSSQVICFTVLGLVTCLVILGTTGIIFFSKCEMWLANAKYRHLLWKQRKHLLQDENEDLSVKIIFPSVNKLTNYGKNYTSI
ncbi:protein delta homolog 1 [Heterodontus francisci]|uniref:protein delta homolog 1 n=1 Tax=Heterodontus francisci TaxID=7792 RepID=UPI00355B8A7C